MLNRSLFRCLKLHQYGNIQKYTFSNTAMCHQNFDEIVVMNVFDRKAKKLQRERANSTPDPSLYDYLKEEVGYRLSDRFYDIKRNFKLCAEIGCGRGYVTKHINSDIVEELIICDSNERTVNSIQAPEGVKLRRQVMDEEDIKFDPESLDAVVSNLSLHWVNNLPGAFKQILNGLKKDGVLIASVFGGDTLCELRSAIQLAELERRGGVAQHISPFTEAKDIGALLQRAGFTLLTIDVDQIVINYPTMFELMWDLKGMGESNATYKRSLHLHRDVQFAAAAIYEQLYGKLIPQTNEIGIPATFQIIGMTAWRPHPDQQQPASRGSAEFSLKDLESFKDIVTEWKTLPTEAEIKEKLKK